MTQSPRLKPVPPLCAECNHASYHKKEWFVCRKNCVRHSITNFCMKPEWFERASHSKQSECDQSKPIVRYCDEDGNKIPKPESEQDKVMELLNELEEWTVRNRGNFIVTDDDTSDEYEIDGFFDLYGWIQNKKELYSHLGEQE